MRRTDQHPRLQGKRSAGRVAVCRWTVQDGEVEVSWQSRPCSSGVSATWTLICNHGNAVRTVARTGTASAGAIAAAMPRRTDRSVRPHDVPIHRIVRSRCRSGAAARAHNFSPAGVRCTPRAVRTSNVVPRSASRRRTWRLSAGWAVPSSAAARVTEPCSAMHRGYSRRWKSTCAGNPPPASSRSPQLFISSTLNC